MLSTKPGKKDLRLVADVCTANNELPVTPLPSLSDSKTHGLIYSTYHANKEYLGK